VSNANRDLALRHGVSNEKKMLTIWNGIPETSHRARPGSAGVPRVVMVARCVEQKDHSLLLRAFARIAEPSRLTFVGGGPKLAALQEEASRLNIADRVEFLGDRFDIAEILSTGHVFALATKWEGFPLSILEAMRAGLPVIASNVGGVAEAVTDETTGFLVERGDVFSFQNRLHSLITDAALRRRMGAAGRHRFESTFTLDHMLRKTLAVYQMAALGVRAAAVSAFPAPPLPRTRADY
jgi:glycosyltransferase involved in cell wall biosynthesis